MRFLRANGLIVLFVIIAIGVSSASSIAKGEVPSITIVMGSFAAGIGMSAMSMVNAEIAAGIAVLGIVGVLLHPANAHLWGMLQIGSGSVGRRGNDETVEDYARLFIEDGRANV